MEEREGDVLLTWETPAGETSVRVPLDVMMRHLDYRDFVYTSW
jgi:hypothetical protein